MGILKGINILEVWDFRLSTATPMLFCDDEFWVVKVFARNPGDKRRVTLEDHKTTVKTTGNPRQADGIIACYEFLRTVRDKYSLNRLEERKPIVKIINNANSEASKISMAMNAAKKDNDLNLFSKLKKKLTSHLRNANDVIDVATRNFNSKT